MARTDQEAQQEWDAVDHYITSALLPADDALDGALRRSAEAGLPAIALAPNQAKLLHLLASSIAASNILEIGTLGGYSAIWLARALGEGGRLETLELAPHHAEVARTNIAAAGLADRVTVHVGAALDLLPALMKLAPFDFVFIDADKANIPAYFEWSVKLARRGAMIIVDNVVRDGKIVDGTSGDASVIGVRRLHAALRTDARVSATTVQTVGAKGYDGFTLALVR